MAINEDTRSRIEDLVMQQLTARADYSRHLNSNSRLKLFFHQTNRIYEAVENGNKRILCADATGAGKTIVALATKFLRDMKSGTRSTALVFAPGQTMDSVWSQESIDSYQDALGIPAEYHNDVVIIDDYKQFKSIGKGTGTVVINYDKLGINENPVDNRYLKSLLDLCSPSDKSLGIGMTIFDEAHRLKNHKTNCCRTIVDLIEKTKDRPAVLLTATPCPNHLSDVGFLLYMLNPSDPSFSKYKSQEFVYAEHQSAIRDVMLLGQWFNFPKDATERIFNLPPLHRPRDEKGLTYVNMNDDEARKYFEIWRPSSTIGEKIIKLRRILMESKIRNIESLVRGFASEDQQTVVYTGLREGVVEPLKHELEKVYGSGKVVIIDGTLDFKTKVKYARAFQQGKYRAIVCTSVISEGIDLSCGDKRVDLVVTEPCITPAGEDQLVGREHRPGQKKDVYMHVLASSSSYLEQMMINEIASLENEYDVKFRRNWRATTIDVDRFNITAWKRMVFENAIRRALPLSEEALRMMEIDDESGDDGQKAYQSTTSLREFGEISVSNADTEFFGKNINQCAPFKGKKYDSSNLKPLLEDYQNVRAWLPSTAAESNRMIAEIIRQLEEVNAVRYELIADLGSGPACLARVLKETSLERRVDCVDGMEEMVQMGREFCQKEGLTSVSFHQAPLWMTGLKAGAYDIVTCCNALHYNDQKDERDIEKIVIEANRVLHHYGYLLITLIPNTKSKDINNLGRIVQRYGFDLKYSDMIEIHGTDRDSRKKRTSEVPVIVAKKVQDYSGDVAGEGILVYSPIRYATTGGQKQVYIFSPSAEKKMRKSTLVDKSYSLADGRYLRGAVQEWR